MRFACSTGWALASLTDTLHPIYLGKTGSMSRASAAPVAVWREPSSSIG